MEELKNFTVYKSSAGSGKTFTLVKEYLAIALNDEANPPQAYRHILAITFTNKAAAEMKERIVKALKELSSTDYSTVSNNTQNLLKALKQHKKLNENKPLGDIEIQERALRVLSAILHNYSDFAIGTIDSFVHKIVRTFAFDLKIPLNFDVETDDEKLLTKAIDMLIAKIGNDEKLTKALIEFAENKADDEKNWHIENELKKFAKNLLKEDGAEYADKLKKISIDDFFSIKEKLFQQIKTFENDVIVIAQKAMQIIISCGLSQEAFYQTGKGIYAYFKNLSEGKTEKISPNSYVQTTMGEDKWSGGKATARDKEAIEKIKSELINCFTQIDIIREERYSNYIVLKNIATNIYSLAVLNEIEKLLSEYKNENSILHISEFNKLIAKVVMNEPIPFIYERLGEKYKNYLIDEFQDTSVLQFQNLLPLIDNALATGNFTMLVGDGKQAIYRWRGGEVEQFSRLPEIFKHQNNPLLLEREAALTRNYNPQYLTKNYRSKKEVIEFNNSFFRTLSSVLDPSYASIYESLEQESNLENTGGFVQVQFIEEEKEEFVEMNLQLTLNTINDLVQQGFAFKDIAILVRRNSEGSQIADFLSKNNIKVISSDSLLLSASREVNFIFSFLCFLHDTNNSIARTEIIEYLIASGKLLDISLNNSLKKKNSGEFIQLLKKAATEFNLNTLNKLPLYELCEELIRVFKLNETPNAYIQFFLDEVLNFANKKNNHLVDFIEHWNDKKDSSSLILPQGNDAVNIMTVHRSKGLEFPVVILPFTNKTIEKSNKYFWVDFNDNELEGLPAAILSANKNLEETEYKELYVEEKNKSLLDELNVLYVAFTRAEDRLYVFTGMPKGDNMIGSISGLLAYYYKTIGEWSDDKKIYSYGKENKHVKDKSTSPALNYQLQSLNSTQWRNSIKMRTAAPSIWNTDMAETKKSYGIIVHTALARIKYEEDIIFALEAMFNEGLIDKEEKNHLIITIQKIVALPELKKYFEKGLKIKNEAEIIMATGDMYRPDRVVINGKEAIIIDYKTGEVKPQHKEQINNYAEMVKQMGYRVEKKLLVYLEKFQVISA